MFFDVFTYFAQRVISQQCFQEKISACSCLINKSRSSTQGFLKIRRLLSKILRHILQELTLISKNVMVDKIKSQRYSRKYKSVIIKQAIFCFFDRNRITIYQYTQLFKARAKIKQRLHNVSTSVDIIYNRQRKQMIKGKSQQLSQIKKCDQPHTSSKNMINHLKMKSMINSKLNQNIKALDYRSYCNYITSQQDYIFLSLNLSIPTNQAQFRR